MNKEKIKGYLSIANKAGYLIIGSDTLKNYNKKLFLVLADESAGKNLIKITETLKNLTENVFFVNELESLTQIKNCKIVGVKNKGLSDEIIKNLRSENFGK